LYDPVFPHIIAIKSPFLSDAGILLSTHYRLSSHTHTHTHTQKKRKLAHDLLTLKASWVYMNFFFQLNTIGGILKNILALFLKPKNVHPL